MDIWFWIVRRNKIVVAALVEGSYSKNLLESLIELSEIGPIERIKTSHGVTMGQQLPEHTDMFRGGTNR